MTPRAVIRAGASAGLLSGAPLDELQTIFSSNDRSSPGDVSRHAGGELSPDDVPGRWNRRRAIAPELAPLPRVVAEALEAAGWWTRGSGAVCPGGLVVANDTRPVLASLEFTEEIHGTPGALVRPAGFLQSLPSTAASVIGLLFGLTDYQACVVNGALAGLQALQHGLDLLALGRLDRVLVASLSVVEGSSAAGTPPDPAATFGLAVALCLESAAHDPEARSERSGTDLTVDCGLGPFPRAPEGPPLCAPAGVLGASPGDLPDGAARLAAVPLLFVAKSSKKWFSGADPGPLTYHLEEPLTGGTAWIQLRKS